MNILELLFRSEYMAVILRVVNVVNASIVNAASTSVYITFQLMQVLAQKLKLVRRLFAGDLSTMTSTNTDKCNI